MLTEPVKPNIESIRRAVNRLSGGKIEQRASELDSDVTSAADSAIASTAIVLSDATSAVKASLAVDISAVSNLAQSNYDSINKIHSSLQAYESALSDATETLSNAISGVTDAHANSITSLIAADTSIATDVATNSNTLSAVSGQASTTSNLAQANSAACSSLQSALSDLSSLVSVMSNALSDQTDSITSLIAADTSLATAIASVESTLSSVVVSTAASIISHMDSAIASIETVLSQATSDARSLASTITDPSSGCSLYLTTAQDITSESLHKIEFDTANYDIGSEFDIITDYEFTANATGYYRVSCVVRFSESVSAGDIVYLRIVKNGNTSFGEQSFIVTVNGFYMYIDIARDVYLAATETIHFEVYQDSGINRLLYTGNNGTFCDIHRISR